MHQTAQITAPPTRTAGTLTFHLANPLIMPVFLALLFLLKRQMSDNYPVLCAKATNIKTGVISFLLLSFRLPPPPPPAGAGGPSIAMNDCGVYQHIGTTEHSLHNKFTFSQQKFLHNYFHLSLFHRKNSILSFSLKRNSVFFNLKHKDLHYNHNIKQVA